MKQNVVVFGKGRYFRKKKQSIEEKYNIIGFIDNAIKVGECGVEDNLPVYNPKEIGRFPDNIPIIFASVKFFEMWKQMIELDVSDDRMLLGLQFYPCIDELENLIIQSEIAVQIKNRKINMLYKNRVITLNDEEDYKKFLRTVYKERFPYINTMANMPLKPVSMRFGQERGMAIDRVYIKKFLETYKQYICGDVMEIAETRYTKQFGSNRVRNSYVLHVNGWGDGVIRGDLVSGEGITEGMVDCLICTQTIPFIYDIHSCVKNIYKLLKVGGVALITTGFIAQLSMYDYENWGEYWRFTDQSLRKLLEEHFNPEDIEIINYGNMKTAISFLYGLCAEDLKKTDFELDDKQYSVIVAAVVKKNF